MLYYEIEYGNSKNENTVIEFVNGQADLAHKIIDLTTDNKNYIITVIEYR